MEFFNKFDDNSIPNKLQSKQEQSGNAPELYCEKDLGV